MSAIRRKPSAGAAERRGPTLATWVTLVRAAFALFAGGLFLRGGADRAAVWVCAASVALDAADGWIARRWRHETALGALLDPVADKLTAFVVFGTIAHRAGSSAVWTLFALGAVRDAGITIQRLSRSGRGRPLIEPDMAGKLKTAFQDVAGLAVLFYVAYGGADLARSPWPAMAATGASVVLSYATWARYCVAFRHGRDRGEERERRAVRDESARARLRRIFG